MVIIMTYSDYDPLCHNDHDHYCQNEYDLSSLNFYDTAIITKSFMVKIIDIMYMYNGYKKYDL